MSKICGPAKNKWGGRQPNTPPDPAGTDSGGRITRGVSAIVTAHRRPTLSWLLRNPKGFEPRLQRETAGQMKRRTCKIGLNTSAIGARSSFQLLERVPPAGGLGGNTVQISPPSPPKGGATKRDSPRWGARGGGERHSSEESSYLKGIGIRGASYRRLSHGSDFLKQLLSSQIRVTTVYRTSSCVPNFRR